MLAGEALTGKPSELIELEREAAAKLGMATPPEPTPATLAEQLATHGGHLALSALAGAAFAAATDDDSLASGAAFGFAFFVAAYGLAGPALGITPLPWRESPLRAVQHPVVHTLFGICTAWFARRARQARPCGAGRSSVPCGPHRDR